MTPPRVSRLLKFARNLQGATSFYDLLELTRQEMSEALGYQHVWLMVADSENPDELRLLEIAGSKREIGLEVAPVIPVRGDAMIEEILRSDEPVVVEDARTDPRTNKHFVEVLGNRTIINLALRMVDQPFGAIGTGTFGDEGCRPPTRPQLDYLIGMASQIAVAVGRIRFAEERRRAEAELRRTEEQLRQAQKMEAVGRLAGGIAHDFNNILSVILSYCALIKLSLSSDDPMLAEIDEIRKAGERAAELTRQLLSFGRQQVAEPRAIDLNESIVAMDRMIRRVIGEDIALQTLPGESLGLVKADPSHIEQIILNLVVNARDAMPNGGKLTVETANVHLDEAYARAHAGVKPGMHVMLAISDDGEGMDKPTLDRIFEPFFTTKAKGRGTGLGLSTVYGIVNQSDGHVWVYSEVGRGTTFKVYFPRTDETKPIAPEKPVAPSTYNGTETILLVEDEAPLREVARHVLYTHGYDVIEAGSGEEAIRESRRRSGTIHLLLTDVVMPGMNGRELADHLTVERPGMRVLYMSGYTENSIVHQRVLDPGIALLQKPITPDVLVRKVREVLSS